MKTNRWILILLLSVVSLLSPATLAISLIVVSIYYCWAEGAAGAVKSLLFITIRCILNPGIAASQSEISTIKWCLLFGLSFYAIIAKPKKQKELSKGSCSQFFLFVAFYSAYLIGASFISGTFPVISTFKVVSWAFIFCAVVYEVYDDGEHDWIQTLTINLCVILVLSLFVLPLDVGYLRNGRGFQGLLNHPNMFGIICALCFCLLMNHGEKKPSFGRIAMILLCVICAFLSQSRTGLFSIVLLTAYALIISDMVLPEKIMAMIGLLVLVCIAVTLYILNDPDRTGSIWTFIFKGHDENILYSREKQADMLMLRFSYNPSIGTGFMAPYSRDYRSMDLRMDLSVEPGNLILTLLGHTGVIGLLLFIMLFYYMFRNTQKDKRIIFVMPFVLSMGEMVFFSSNNISILFYLLLGCCFKPASRSEKKEARLPP